MNYPLVPLVPFLSWLNDANESITMLFSIILLGIGLGFLVWNAFLTKGYQQDFAKKGFLFCGAAVFMSVFGVLNLVVAFALWLLAYWVGWRFFILNVVAIFKGAPPKNGGGPRTS